MTVAELRTGVKQPLSNLEFIMWHVYHGRIAQRKEIAMKEAQQRG